MSLGGANHGSPNRRETMRIIAVLSIPLLTIALPIPACPPPLTVPRGHLSGRDHARLRRRRPVERRPWKLSAHPPAHMEPALRSIACVS